MHSAKFKSAIALKMALEEHQGCRVFHHSKLAAIAINGPPFQQVLQPSIVQGVLLKFALSLFPMYRFLHFLENPIDFWNQGLMFFVKIIIDGFPT